MSKARRLVQIAETTPGFFIATRSVMPIRLVCQDVANALSELQAAKPQVQGEALGIIPAERSGPAIMAVPL
jgi:hypothetical protein